MSNCDQTLRTVGEVAQLLGLSVRTLHYWEQRGLVVPSYRSIADYRLYSTADIERLQLVMIYKATGMSISAIIDVLSQDSMRITHLRKQRTLLIEKQAEVQQMLNAIDVLLTDAQRSVTRDYEKPTGHWEYEEQNLSEENFMSMSEEHSQGEQSQLSVEEIAQILGEANFAAYQEEAEKNWGDTQDWEISQRTISQRSAADWQDAQQQQDKLDQDLSAAYLADVAPGSETADALVERHREWLSSYFPVTHSKQVLIARGYVADPRFRAHYDNYAQGLATWLKDSIDARAVKCGVDPETAEWA